MEHSFIYHKDIVTSKRVREKKRPTIISGLGEIDSVVPNKIVTNVKIGKIYHGVNGIVSYLIVVQCSVV